MNQERYVLLQKRLPELRKQRASSAFGEIPKSIAELGRMLDTNPDDRADIYPLLLQECSDANNDRAYLHYVRRSAVDLPNDPMTRTGMAFTIAVVEPSSRDEALKNGLDAVELAKKQNRLVRYAAMNLARIALLLDSYDELRHALSILISDRGNRRQEDAAFQFDFVEQIDPQRCGVQLLAEYKALARREY